MTADEIIKTLDLSPHPEGGYFRETFRDSHTVGPTGRAASTAILFLLKAGEISRWHTVDAAEIWHYHAGATLELGVKAPDGPLDRLLLGNNLANGEVPQIVVPRDHWQQARTLGDFTLVGCTVAPGFEFSGFVLAKPGFGPAS